VVTNVAAICETCHGKLHRWKYRQQFTDHLYSQISRLSRPAA
jgi:hypothetical protein